MNNQTHMIDSIMSKIEIKETTEELQRISIFLANNHIEHSVVNGINSGNSLEEFTETIEWPL